GQGSSQGGNRYQGQGGPGGNRYQGQGSSQGGNRYQGSRPQGGPGGMSGRGPAGGRMSNVPKAPVEAKPLEKEGRAKNERGLRNERKGEKVGKGDKLDRMERGHQTQKTAGKGKGTVKTAVKPAPQPVVKEEVIKNIVLPDTLTIKELAEKMKIQPAAIVKKLFLQGTMVTVNQEIDFDTAEEIALDYNCMCEKEVKVDVLEELLKEDDDAADTLTARPPVVCVMGHVDHGKTSLLDAIRNTHVIDREAGGITQHIGASVITCNGEKITFLDTPGHEAFTSMRMRGANSTDIAILVVAADDGVMPQTIEAINHAKAAGIEIIVAINKIDKPSANVERVKQELTEYELIPEDWGGSTVFVPVSAHTHEGIDTLLEMVLLTSEVLELKANPKRRARGLVIEAQLDKGRGPVATVLVQKGTLHVGDPVCAGACHGKVRAMMDDKGRKVKEAGPSTPVEILGFSDVPNAGDIFVAPETEKEARSFAETFISEGREKLLEDTKAKMSLDDLFTQIKAGNLKELNLIVKADVQGSVEAVKQSLLKISNDEVVVKIIHGGVGAINESDVILASASNAIIIGFNVRPDAMAKTTAEREGVDVRLYRVIYDAIADVEAAMKGMLDPIFEEKIIGHAEVRQTFKASGVGTIAGGYILDGMFQRGCTVRITREGGKVFEGALASLKRFKDDVKEVKAGYECGLVFEKFNDVKEEDQVEAYIMVEVPR
ncbi:MAG: translation initiation factor IF-2, partial [Lachnospiraceae bacterium]|nr:translation initiation factor IF-2 [Lachnospiraceae bacterium]